MCEAEVCREIYKTKKKESELSEVVVVYQIFHRLDICNIHPVIYMHIKIYNTHPVIYIL